VDQLGDRSQVGERCPGVPDGRTSTRDQDGSPLTDQGPLPLPGRQINRFRCRPRPISPWRQNGLLRGQPGARWFASVVEPGDDHLVAQARIGWDRIASGPRRQQNRAVGAQHHPPGGSAIMDQISARRLTGRLLSTAALALGRRIADRRCWGRSRGRPSKTGGLPPSRGSASRTARSKCTQPSPERRVCNPRPRADVVCPYQPP